MHITFTNHVQHTPVVLDQAQHPNSIHKTHDAIKELLKALKNGLRTIDLHERVWTALSLKKDSLNKVIFLWDKCIGAIINQQGEPLLESVTELMKAQGEHPAEFSVLISHMERMKMKNIFKYLQALGNVYLM